MFTKSKTVLTIAVAVVALTAASLAATGDAFAKGGQGGGKGGGPHWHNGFGGGIVIIDSGCWQWIPGYGKVWVCGY